MKVTNILNAINSQDCLANTSFAVNWQRYKESMEQFLGEYPSREKIIKLGGEMSHIFVSNDEYTRGQSDVSVSGNAWSRLIGWYLNLCLLGTNCWATNNYELIPPTLKRALTLSLNDKKVQNSKEIILICYNGGNIPEVTLPNDLSYIDMKSTYSSTISEFLHNIKLDEIKVFLISAKTSGSDLLAIPLFWNFCYKGNLMKDLFEITVGNQEENPEKLIGNRVFYSVVTVPSGKEEKIIKGTLPGQAALNKLALLDGGFYWGRKSSERVRSFEYFIRDNLSDFGEFAGDFASKYYEYRNDRPSFINKLFIL